MVYHCFTHMIYLYSCNGFTLVPKDSMVHNSCKMVHQRMNMPVAKPQILSTPIVTLKPKTSLCLWHWCCRIPCDCRDSAISWKLMMFHDVCSWLVTIYPDLPWMNCDSSGSLLGAACSLAMRSPCPNFRPGILGEWLQWLHEWDVTKTMANNKMNVKHVPDAPWCWNIYQHLPEQNQPVL